MWGSCTSPTSAAMQNTQRTGHGEFHANTERLQAAAATAGKIKRDTSAHHGSLYLSAAVGATYLSSDTGKRSLEVADAASKALWEAAVEKHGVSEQGALKEYGWAMVRAMFPGAPNKLHLWGRPNHKPPPTAPSAHP